jgi:hypothetical protein
MSKGLDQKYPIEKEANIQLSVPSELDKVSSNHDFTLSKYPSARIRSTHGLPAGVAPTAAKRMHRRKSMELFLAAGSEVPMSATAVTFCKYLMRREIE